MAKKPKVVKERRTGIRCPDCDERTEFRIGMESGVAGFEDWGYCPDCNKEWYRFQDAQDGSVTIEGYEPEGAN